MLLLIAALGVWAPVALTRHGNRYATLTGKGYRPQSIDLGRWR